MGNAGRGVGLWAIAVLAACSEGDEGAIVRHRGPHDRGVKIEVTERFPGIAASWLEPSPERERVVLPDRDTTSATFELGPKNDPRRLRVRRVDGANGRCVRQGHYLRCGGADRIEALMYAYDGGVEDLAVAEHDGEVAYEVLLPEGSSLVQVSPSLVEVRQGRGAWFRIRASIAWDELGREHSVQLRVLGSRVRAIVDDPARGAHLIDPLWQITSDMSAGRTNHTATLLQSGRVLIAGGCASQDNRPCAPSSSAEIYDPTTGMFTRLKVGMNTVRAGHVAERLKDGRVLIVAGDGSDTTCELFDENGNNGEGSFETTASLGVAHFGDTASLLLDGRVAVIGSEDSSAIDIYDPKLATFTTVSDVDGQGDIHDESLKLLARRSNHTATVLADGRIVIAGGEPHGATGNGQATDTVLRIQIEPNNAIVIDQLASLKQARRNHAAVLLGDGRVMVWGGAVTDEAPDALGSAEVIQSDGVVTMTDGLVPRRDHELVLLDNGWVLASGGSLAGTTKPPTLVRTVPPPEGLTAYPSEEFGEATSALPHDPTRAHHTATKLEDGSVLIAGGRIVSGAGVPFRTAVRFVPQAPGASAKCNVGGECSTGFCADGVCCDQPCMGECATCATGACEPTPGAACGTTGYVCDAAFDCPTSCDEICGAKYRCVEHACVPAKRCEGSSIVDELTGQKTACDPAYNCRDDDDEPKCFSDCRSTVDCTSGHRCSQDYRCVPQIPFAEVASCALSDSVPEVRALYLALGGIVLGLARRRGRNRS